MLELSVVNTAMRKMVKDGYFSICTIDTCCKVLNVYPVGHSYNLLRALHCVHFVDMPKEVRESLPRLVAEVFGQEMPKLLL